MPRPLAEQVIVLTGASSGIGRLAALMFGERGASVVLAARDAQALDEVALEVEQRGGKALAVPTDVADWLQVQRLVTAAVDRFGRIDTWVNNAGVTLAGTVEDCDVEEIERLTRVTYFGQVYGVKAALPQMRRQGGGAFINVGSVAGARTFPIQTCYSATKHAIRAFTEGLRLELRRSGGDFHVSYIAPGSINTPLFPDTRSHLGVELGAPPPIYEPDIVAESIVFAAEHPRRDIVVGGGPKLFEILQRISPGLTDWLMTRGDKIFKDQYSDRPDGGPGNLFEPPATPRRIRGPLDRQAHATSHYTRVFEWHPALKTITLGALAIGAVAMLRGSSRPPDGPLEHLRHAARKAARSLR